MSIQEARIKSVLDTKMNFDSLGILSRRDWLTEQKRLGSTVKIVEVPSVKYNRAKYNRMDAKQQTLYEQKLNTLKPEPRLVSGDGSGVFWVITKIEYDYFKSLS